MIISISGLAGSGKDEIAKILINRHNFTRIAMADVLKELCASVFRLPLETFHDVNLKDKPFDEPMTFDQAAASHLAYELNELGYDVCPVNFVKFLGEPLENPRKILVYIGTDVCRNTVDKDIWLNLTMKKIKSTEGHVVVTDARFKNERNAIKSMGGIKMFVDRPIVTKAFDASTAHGSETDQLNDDYDVYVMNDRTIAMLQHDIDLWIGARLKFLL